MKYVKNYKNNKVLRDSFNELADKTFGINFEKWFQAGAWNDSYVCYSMVDENNHIVSNVSTSRYQMMLSERVIDVVQIGTVMTDEKHRCKGYARDLMNKALEDHKDADLVFLYGDASALGFYRNFGFETNYEKYFNVQVSKEYHPLHTMRKMDVSSLEDLELLKRISEDRKVISRICDGIGAQSISVFHGMYLFPEHLYYIEDLDTILYMTKRDNQINLYGYSSTKEVSMDQILNEIVTDDIKMVKCMFTVSETEETIEHERVDYEGDEFFVMKKEGVVFPENFHFPYIFKA